MAKVAARYGGIYASHIRGEGAEVVQSVRELIAISEGAGLPGEVFHLEGGASTVWGILMDSVRQVVDAARARGVDVAADMYVYTAGGTGLEATIPSWAFEGGGDSLRARLDNPEIRARLKREQQTGSPGWWNIVEAAGGWDGIILANARNPENAKYERQVAQRHRDGNGEGAGRCRDGSGAPGQGPGDGDLPHDVGAGHRDRAPLSLDQHRQRRRRRAGAGADRSDRTAASALLRERGAGHRRVREAPWRPVTGGGDPENDVMAGDPDATGGPGNHQGGQLGRCDDLRSRRLAGPRHL